MSRFKVLIADDEPVLCNELKCILMASGEAEVVAVCHNGEDVAGLTEKYEADVLFLDIQMPGMGGMAVAKAISHQPEPPMIVFVTAFSQYALDAFKVDAVDYILKPFDERDIERVLRKLHQRWQGQAGQKRRSFTRNILGEAGDRLEVVAVEQIQHFRAEDRQVFMKTTEGVVFEVKHRLNELELILNPLEFFRCHRNFIVNANQVQQIANWFNRGYLLIMKGDSYEIPVGRAFVGKMKQYFQV
jgi:DNA-binding LytR/AlgR family response regulator